MPEKDGGAGTLASFDPGIQASAPLVMEQLIGDSCSQGKQIKREIRLKKKNLYDIIRELPRQRGFEWADARRKRTRVRSQNCLSAFCLLTLGCNDRGEPGNSGTGQFG